VFFRPVTVMLFSVVSLLRRTVIVASGCSLFGVVIVPP